MLRIIFSICFISILSVFTANAQDDLFEKPEAPSEKNIWNYFTYDMGNVFGGVGYAYSRPLHWQGDDFLRLGGVAAGTTGLFLLDDEIRHRFLSHKDDVPDILLDYGRYAGAPQNNYGITGAVYLTGLITKNEKLRRTGVLMISAATAAGFIQQVSKTLVGRARPGAGFGNHHFKPNGGSAAYRSFPSGHAVLTFTTAYTISKQFDNKWVKGGIIAVGLIPGLSRIYEEAHWASDVALSWAMSAFIVEAIDRYLDKKYDKKYNEDKGMAAARSDFEWNLTFGGNQLGVVFQF
ncbi:phosphatase PAP2 family protein [Leeuwenhoekiella marinoflava]|uniref:PAP2 superfamily protein n=2 Tax=Leeuwenhoekiella marinoflava TaxID=988 RepID=A0A4Q0PMX5_9FLAO|nr:phosphatase PAP2 family protein [Leeuwenhoekiella marinoflava]RXG31879.1 PAP2 superfamily protein [Leeuwenhoekiella marinoflava]SHE90122.1 PAP2 superfamily protein [Leeuwenhoekiella marinoflava DSM 3653]